MVTIQKELEIEEARLCFWKTYLDRLENGEAEKMARCHYCNGYNAFCDRYRLSDNLIRRIKGEAEK